METVIAKSLKGISRFLYVETETRGIRNIVSYKDEEQIVFILEGTGNLIYNEETIPVSKNDFAYVPSGVKFGFQNSRERSVKAILMGFRIPDGTLTEPGENLMTANADEVKFQVLGQHGPTTQFQLLMGTTESKRDRLAAATRVNSLFIMDFAPGGTNIPHHHANEEEICFVLKGAGEMVAGETADGEEIRYPVKEGEEHTRILAVRSKIFTGSGM